MKLQESRGQAFAAVGAVAAVVSLYAFVQGTTDERVRCWDGSLETRAQDCAAPHGESGLSWLFPSLASALGCEVDVPNRPNKTAVRVCASTAAGETYLIRYTAWKDSASAFRWYDEQYAAEPTPLESAGQRVGDQWSTSSYTSPRGLRFKMSGAFYDAAYSWSVEASSASALDRGRRELEIRAVDGWAVERELGFWERLKHGLTP